MPALPHLDMDRPGFSTRGPEVHAARDASWVATTPYGLAILRHAEAGRILRDRRFRQGSHAWPDTVGLTGSFAAFWTRSVIGMEGVQHKSVRRVAQTALSPDWIENLRPTFRAHAETLAPQGTVDFMDAFAGPFAGHAICTLLGLPMDHWRSLSRDATTLGRAMGLDAKTHEADVNAACDRLLGLADDLMDQRPEGCVSRMVAADSISRDTLRDLIVITIFGGVDTTRAQLGLGLGLLTDHPDQWDALRADPALIPAAIEEFIRHRPTTTWSTREVCEPVTINGMTIDKGTTVHILAHATGTDPGAHDSRFDITRPRKIHFGFGGGAHHCLGQAVARADMAEALGVIVSQTRRVERAGTPVHLPETGNTGPINLPLTFVPTT